MDHHALLNFIEAHPAWAGLVVGLLSLIEGTVLIGLLVPLSALLIAIGAAVAFGRWSPWALVWSLAGVSLGNVFSYELGRHLPQSSRDALAARAPRLFAAGTTLFAAHGAFALVVARFVGPPASAPFLAGYLGLSRHRFLGALVICALWVPTAAAFGYVPAKGLIAASPPPAMWAVAVVSALIGALLGALAIRRKARKALLAAKAEPPVDPTGLGRTGAE
jgi:membrane protein DedA with SNARE-associated domain